MSSMYEAEHGQPESFGEEHVWISSTDADEMAHLVAENAKRRNARVIEATNAYEPPSLIETAIQNARARLYDRVQETRCARRYRPPSVALMGAAGSGKDTVAGILAEEYGHERVAFADPLKSMALAIDPIVYIGPNVERGMRMSEVVDTLGWEAAKREVPEVRRFLQRLGSEGVRDHVGPQTWINLADGAVRAAFAEGRPVAITDCRFPNEVEYARRIGALVVRVERPGVEPVAAHKSENATADVTPDYVCHNTGSLALLRTEVRALMGEIYAEQR